MATTKEQILDELYRTFCDDPSQSMREMLDKAWDWGATSAGDPNTKCHCGERLCDHKCPAGAA